MSKRCNKQPAVLCVLAAAGGWTATQQSGLETHVVDLLTGPLLGVAHAADSRLDAVDGLVRKYDARQLTVADDRILIIDGEGRKRTAPDGTYLFPNGSRILVQKGRITQNRKVAGNLRDEVADGWWHENYDPGWRMVREDDASGRRSSPDVRQSLREAQNPRAFPGDQFDPSEAKAQSFERTDRLERGPRPERSREFQFGD